MRPNSSVSQRPSSAGTSRPSSSMSHASSVASQRAASRISLRPLSRMSQRPSTRQSRVLCQALVTKLTGLTPDEDDDFDIAYDLAIRRIDGTAKQAVSPDLQTVQQQLRRLSKKARIQSHDDLAEAFNIINERLRAEAEKRGDLDNEISVSNLPEHLQLLFLLTAPPSSSSLEFAAEFVDQAHNPKSAPSALTWAEILKEEPLKGQHWQGAYGLPPGGVAEQWEQGESTDSSPLLSEVSGSELDDRDDLFSSEGLTDESERVLTPPPLGRDGQHKSLEERVADSLRLRLELEALQNQQYWRKTWQTDALLDRAFDLGEPSTLSPSFQRVISAIDRSHHTKPENARYINEHDAIREILIALQGQSSILFERNGNVEGLPSTIIQVSEDTPRLLHLTPSAQQSILSKFASLSTTLNRLRIFLTGVIRDVGDLSTQRNNSRTIEAFAEALELETIRFEAWMAQTEEIMLRSHSQNGRGTVISLLSLEKAIRDEFSDSFDELLNIICSSFPGSAWLNRHQIFAHVRLSPSSFSSRLLDALFDAIQRRQSFGDAVTASGLMRVFLKTAEPVWKMLGRWLRDGIFMPEANSSVSDQNSLPQEFFIESNGLDVADSDFWAYGYSLRSRSFDESTMVDHSGVPTFLRSLVENILGAGKSIGLLRILGHGGSFDHGKLSAAAWPTFETFMFKLHEGGSIYTPHGIDMPNAILSADNLSLLLSDYLLPICSSAEKMLKNVLYTDCDLLHHLRATEDLFLSRKGDVMGHFCDVLFSAIDAKKVWTDYHFLNTTFREAVGSSKAHWIDSSLVRLSYKSSSKNAMQRSVDNFDGIVVDYAAPFPLVFIFGSSASRIYNAVFVLLIKIRRAKTFLDNILLRTAATNTVRTQDELKIFYATRSRLSWFVKCAVFYFSALETTPMQSFYSAFLNFICSYVLHIEVERFHSSLRGASSLDDIIELHQKHLCALEKLCFLDEKTAALQRALLSILDMSVSFSDCFVAFAGDTTLNTSRASISRPRRHRSRRQRRESRDIVSYAPVSSFRDEESDSSDSDLDESLILQEIAGDTSLSFAASQAYESFGEDDFFDRNEKMGKDLDSLVRYIRREVERLALTIGGSQFDVLAFSLQGWDL